ncbi:LysR family transcriptional regulator [Pseudoroseicyclus tamaricis]|uniref:LysR family transcriptional regulator n=1 Tax=Pseudoroseicyclus tamaricis TaxID=2705421 RepID=A0A6B2K3T7_9RHOB|nr:LysR family transcriptional regulator [Pseudoroseicyclus tamaricis]NDV02472.1 LysR family transcriptional regulator [Pseudoroseicyclus tamaricis]
MPRNLDMVALRSFVAVAETGGVTRAAGFLNLTQSAVSMQLKRLEESMNLSLFERAGRGVALTAAGEQLLSYARRMLRLNDEIYARLTAQEFEGEVVLGVPHDVIYPAIPLVLQKFAADFPRVRVQLLSSFTRRLVSQFSRGEADVILTTESELREGGETLAERPLVWLGAPGGEAWKQRPLRLAYEQECIFRLGVQERLDRDGVEWEMAVSSNSSRTIEATVSADLAVHTMIEGTEPRHFERIQHGGALPELWPVKVNMYASDQGGPPVAALADMLRQAYLAG